MAKNLTICPITEPVANANARGEGTSGGAEIQVIEGKSALTGVGTGYGLREGMTAIAGTDRMFRKHNVNETPTGYGYGPENKALSEVMDLLKDPSFLDYIDSRLGIMLAAKGGETFGRRGSVQKSVSFSTTPYTGTQLMQQGHKADGNLVPTHIPIHVTRYGMRYSINLEDFEANPDHLYVYILTIIRGFPVGGSQTCLSNLVRPAVVMWNTHRSLGGGLNPLGYTTENVDSAPNIDFFIKQANMHGMSFKIRGDYSVTLKADDPKTQAMVEAGPTPLIQAADEMFCEAMECMGLDPAAELAKAKKMILED